MGYASRTDSDGCAAPGYTFKNGERLLPIISSGTGPSALLVWVAAHYLPYGDVSELTRLL